MSLDHDLAPPRAMPPEWERFEDAVEDAREDSLFEAALVGDLGFEDRVFGAWSGHPDFGAPPDPPELDELEDSRPADPIEVMGAAGWLRTVRVAQSRADARFLAAIHVVAHHGGARDAWGRPVRDEGGVDEVAVAMGWSRSMAAARVTLAEAVIDRMPRLYEAMVDGRLDVAKVSTIARHTTVMPSDLASQVAARVEDLAAGVSCSELAEVIASIAVQLDPDWARRREQAARARARVEYARTVEGTADVALRDVSAAAGIRIRERIEALAVPLRAVGRAQGFAVGIGLARAMVAERLCDGGAVGLDDTALLTRLIDDLPAWLAELDDDPDENGPSGPDDGGPHSSGPDDDPDGDGPHDGGPDDGGPDDGGPDDGGPDDGGPDDGGPDDSSPDDSGPGGGGPDDGGPDGDGGTRSEGADEAAAKDAGPSAGREADAGETDADDEGPKTGGPAGAAGECSPEVWAGTVELRLRLSTALGLDELPAELPGSGVLTAPAARAMLEQVRRGSVPVECRLVLTNPHGHLEHVLLVPLERDRPPIARRNGRRARGSVIVELAAATTMLHDLDPDTAALAAGVHWRGWLRRARKRLAELSAEGGDQHPATSQADADKRFPGRELDRHIRVRDRRCMGPFCAEPAHRAEIDHTRDWQHHGRTLGANLGAPCHHCHRLKTRHGWRLEQPEPGRFVWHTPLGQTHHTAPRPVLTTPADPAPRPDGRPRPVLDTRQQPRPGPDGWIDHRPRAYLPATIPTPREPRPSRWNDEPPPF